MKKIFTSILIALIIAQIIFLINLNYKSANYTCNDCNVLIITLDALRAPNLGAYGYERNTSPNIDELAKISYQFNNHFSNAGYTFISLPSLMTGEYPILTTIKLDDNSQLQGFVITNQTTIAKALNKLGYETNIFFSSTFINLTNTLNDFNYVYFIEDNNLYGDNVMIDKLISKLKKNKKQFNWIHLNSPHGPYEPYENIFLNDTYYGNLGIVNISNLTSVYINYNETTIDLDYYLSLYDSEIFWVDNAIGRLLKHMQDEKLLDKTIIIISADHAETIYNEKFIFDHGNMYDSSNHIPLIIHNPGDNQIATINNLTQGIDIFPTIFDMLGIKSSKNSLIRLVKNESFNVKPVFIKDQSGFAIRTEDTKLIANAVLEMRDDKVVRYYDYELYFLNEDPEEKNNVAKINKEIINQLLQWVIN